MHGTSSRVRVVCFDLGGVLLRITDGWAAAGERAGLRRSAPAEGPLAAGFEALHHRFERGDISEAAFVGAVAADGRCSPEDVRALLDARLVGLYPGVADIIDRLRANQLPTACLTNTNVRHWRALMDPAGRFRSLTKLDHRFASHLLGARKPDPAAHRCVEGRLGIAPTDILFLDDAPVNVEGARRSGWRAEWVDPSGEPTDQILRHLRRHHAV